MTITRRDAAKMILLSAAGLGLPIIGRTEETKKDPVYRVGFQAIFMDIMPSKHEETIDLKLEGDASKAYLDARASPLAVISAVPETAFAKFHDQWNNKFIPGLSHELYAQLNKALPQIIATIEHDNGQYLAAQSQKLPSIYQMVMPQKANEMLAKEKKSLSYELMQNVPFRVGEKDYLLTVEYAVLRDISGKEPVYIASTPRRIILSTKDGKMNYFLADDVCNGESDFGMTLKDPSKEQQICCPTPGIFVQHLAVVRGCECPGDKYLDQEGTIRGRESNLYVGADLSGNGRKLEKAIQLMLKENKVI
jgi:hypothetical protein